MADMVIPKQLEKRKIKRDVDVTELYLGESELTETSDLSRFKNLKYLWLNGNQLRTVECLSNNYRLSELYLQDNNLVDLSGCLGHLTSLTTLFLNNNQLQALERVVSELRTMKHLHNLNLFNNPLAQEAGYRSYVVFNIPSVSLLDRREVLTTEKEVGGRMYNQDVEIIKDTIAFGRRTDGPPSLHYPGGQPPTPPTVPADYEVGNNFYRNNPPYATEEQAISARAGKRSVTEYTSFDWSKVPSSQQRRCADKPFENPQIITTRFR